jgi:hypothetical protein
VTIVLERSQLLSVPTSALVHRTEDGHAVVFVVRDGVARRVPVRIDMDNGVRASIRSGLQERDVVIQHPPRGFEDGTPVVSLFPESR